MNLLAFDIGGTWIRGGLFVGQKLAADLRAPVSSQYKISRQRMIDLGVSMTSGKRIDRVIVGLPGVLNTAHTALLRSPHLPAWQRKPLAFDMRRIFRVPVQLENDATLGAVGEAIFGAGRGYRTVAYIAIGTGIGGTCLVNGSTFGRTNLEPGHQFVERGKTWEDLIGGRSLQRRFGADWGMWKSQQWHWIEQQLAAGLVNIITLWSPDCIVLGGAIVRDGQINLPAVKRLIAGSLRAIPQVPPLAKASRGDRAGLYGALAVAGRRSAR